MDKLQLAFWAGLLTRLLITAPTNDLEEEAAVWWRESLVKGQEVE